MLVEDVHFRMREATAFQIGWKAMARNISDIAAMGGVPRYALISMGARPDLEVPFLDRIFNGINSAAEIGEINIVGGDTVIAGKLTIDVSLIGEVEKERLVLRSGARKGDLIFVTGALGGSMKGKHLSFVPRLKEARWLVSRFKINSMIDISDGLSLDLWRILDASGTGARIYEDLIPVSKEARSFAGALRDGEDFELLFTITANEAKRFFKSPVIGTGTPITCIGEITARSEGYNLIRANGKAEKLKPEGYLHF
jgi:thiamine-monophosphate kinase